jgi:hypothetical protein
MPLGTVFHRVFQPSTEMPPGGSGSVREEHALLCWSGGAATLPTTKVSRSPRSQPICSKLMFFAVGAHCRAVEHHTFLDDQAEALPSYLY